MVISLEKIDEVIRRTGISYTEAKQALEFADGDVLEAIIYAESLTDYRKSGKAIDTDQIIENLKEFIDKGNVTRIVLEKDDKVILDIPVLAGALGSLIFTSASVSGIVAALVLGCQLKIVKESGDVINISELTEEKAKVVKEKFTKYEESFKEAMKEHKKEEDAPCGEEKAVWEEPTGEEGAFEEAPAEEETMENLDEAVEEFLDEEEPEENPEEKF